MGGDRYVDVWDAPREPSPESPAPRTIRVCEVFRVDNGCIPDCLASQAPKHPGTGIMKMHYRGTFRLDEADQMKGPPSDRYTRWHPEVLDPVGIGGFPAVVRNERSPSIPLRFFPDL
jgi:hypothetical protein